MERKFDDDILEKFKAFDENYAEIICNINKAKAIANREDEIILLAATKTVSTDVINYAMDKGIDFIGENKVQELTEKLPQLNLTNKTVHFIGHLQTNKVRQIVDKVDMIESVDSVKLATEIDKECKKTNKIMPVLLEINIGSEQSKSGINIQEDIEKIVTEISLLQNLQIKGLMTIPPICENKEDLCEYFRSMRKIFDEIANKKLNNVTMKYLSMGMSDDYYEAILNGANIVRIGSKLFGKRIYR